MDFQIPRCHPRLQLNCIFLRHKATIILIMESLLDVYFCLINPSKMISFSANQIKRYFLVYWESKIYFFLFLIIFDIHQIQEYLKESSVSKDQIGQTSHYHELNLGFFGIVRISVVCSVFNIDCLNLSYFRVLHYFTICSETILHNVLKWVCT